MKFVKLMAGLVSCAIVASGAVAATADPAANYPNRPIRLMVPNAPGASVDTLSRIVAASLSEVLGHQVVIRNHERVSAAVGLDADDIGRTDEAPPGFDGRGCADGG